MLSKILSTVIDRGKGHGLEPALRMVVKNSDDVRDSLLKSLFQSASLHSQGNNMGLIFEYLDQKRIATDQGEPDLEYHLIVRAPREGERMVAGGVVYDQEIKEIDELLLLIDHHQGISHKLTRQKEKVRELLTIVISRSSS
ncbi:hypothetical protein CLV58_12542 [Spirosoma oryzae]|uniref:Uncharacterized protein n=1 Tax=Spirosoma oryzae TaxID=1469603 RepID=A0A2T0S8M8_9BACT|nr:hypothetical protein [Spirosoma oryzae]PRY29780.1 hypothetical protein CLV58_12542 [Spirosoma oryzae]